MIAKLFTLISLLDQSITRDRAIIAAAQERIARAERRKALAQLLLGRQRAR
jgi:hypothetical protein